MLTRNIHRTIITSITLLVGGDQITIHLVPNHLLEQISHVVGHPGSAHLVLDTVHLDCVSPAANTIPRLQQQDRFALD